MYNANPNYEMDFMILKDVNEHMEGLFQRFSKLLPFRIDFAYRKDTPSFGHSCRHSMCIEMHRLLSETQTMLAGYYWVMEYTSNKGLHIHFIGYLDGQRHKKFYRISRQLGDIWSRITEGEGYFHLCSTKDKYPVLMNPLMILVKIIKLRWIHILSYDQMVSRKINNQTTRVMTPTY
ncbi:inovirus-type Gp2 protein [Escherichia coli]|nr:inovirus-type Gp2 protein [Escherichia coli]